jgi:DNA-binding NtrC family response regulator
VRAALAKEGFAVETFTDSMAAVLFFDTPNPVDVLVTRIQFGKGRPHGVSLAYIAKRKRPGVKVVFVAKPEFAQDAEGIGEFHPMPLPAAEVVHIVKRLLAANQDDKS